MATLLYHYSDKLFDQIKSISKLENTSEKEIEKEYKTEVLEYCSPNVYIKQISFFIDPLPLDRIASIYDHKSKVWVSGKPLYMYTVDADTFPKDIQYMVAETPIATKLLNDSYSEWPKDENSKEYREFVKKFKCRKLKILEENKDVGYGLNNLIQKIDLYKGKINSYFEKAQSSQYKDDLYTLYAAGVPHVMVYPESGVINYLNVRKVKIA